MATLYHSMHEQQQSFVMPVNLLVADKHSHIPSCFIDFALSSGTV